MSPGLGTAHNGFAGILLGGVMAFTSAYATDARFDEAVAKIDEVFRQAEVLADDYTRSNTEANRRLRRLRELRHEAGEATTFYSHVVSEFGDSRPKRHAERLRQIELNAGSLAERASEALNELQTSVEVARQASTLSCDFAAQGGMDASNPADQRRGARRVALDDARRALEEANDQGLLDRALILRELRRLQADRNEAENELQPLVKMAADTREGFVEALAKTEEADKIQAQLEIDSQRLAALREQGKDVAVSLTTVPMTLAPYAGSAEAYMKELEYTARLVAIGDAYKQELPGREHWPPEPRSLFKARHLRQVIARWEQDVFLPSSQLLVKARSLVDKLAHMATSLGNTGDVLFEAEYAKGMALLAQGADCLSVEELIADCDYGQAQATVGSMEPGPVKMHLEGAIERGQRLERELRDEIETARRLYRNCEFEGIGAILDRAENKAKCDRHIRSIRKKRQILRDKTAYENITRRIFNEANALYREGQYTEALGKLQQARTRTTCQRYRDSLSKKIRIVESAIGRSQPVVRPTPQPPSRVPVPAVIHGMLYKVWKPPYGPGSVCLTAAEVDVKLQEGNNVEPLNQPCTK